MSGSLASAKRRRAGVQSTTPTPTPTPTPVSTPSSGASAPRGRMSLPQLLNSIDARLKVLETSKPETTETSVSLTANEFTVTDQNTGEERKMNIPDYMTDMDKKFFMLAEEITTIKDVVLKLQSFTMEVNKTLMEERVRILSDVNENIEIDEESKETDTKEKESDREENVQMEVTKI
jgi:hypothetical protein